jgi:hypothetical protein
LLFRLPRADDGVMAPLLPKKQPEGETKFRRSRNPNGFGSRCGSAKSIVEPPKSIAKAFGRSAKPLKSTAEAPKRIAEPLKSIAKAFQRSSEPLRSTGKRLREIGKRPEINTGGINGSALGRRTFLSVLDCGLSLAYG